MVSVVGGVGLLVGYWLLGVLFHEEDGSSKPGFECFQVITDVLATSCQLMSCGAGQKGGTFRSSLVWSSLRTCSERLTGFKCRSLLSSTEKDVDRCFAWNCSLFRLILRNLLQRLMCFLWAVFLVLPRSVMQTVQLISSFSSFQLLSSRYARWSFHISVISKLDGQNMVELVVKFLLKICHFFLCGLK